MGDTHITGRHLGRDTQITSAMCAGIHIGDTHITVGFHNSRDSRIPRATSFPEAAILLVRRQLVEGISKWPHTKARFIFQTTVFLRLKSQEE